MKKILSFFTSRMFWFFALIGVQVIFWVYLATQLEEHRAWINNAFWIGSILLTLWVTTRPENPAYKIGWIILILAVPVLGILLYFFFSARKMNRRDRERGAEIRGEDRPYLLPAQSAIDSLGALSLSALRQSEYIYAASSFPVWEHTSTKYYPMGQDFFADLVEDLKKAEKYIYMEYFIVQRGVMFDTIFDVLVEKARAGLDVRFMYDDIGSMTKLPPHFAETMRANGIQCQIFNPLRPILNSMFNNRDHRKITVIDGKVGYTGGANLADEYINAKKRFGVWKDEAIRLEGAAVWSLLVMFQQLWSFAAKRDMSLEPYVGEKESNADHPSDGYVQPFGSNPLGYESVAQRVYLNMIVKAKKYIYINTPYLDIGNELLNALAIAAQSGVDVRLTVPHIPDKKLVFLLTKSYFPMLIRAGVKIYEYTPGFIHSKTFVSDDRYGVVGTINMDFRSLFLHWECGVWLYESSCLKTLKQDYLDTMRISHEVTYAETQQINFFERVLQAILHVFGPLL